MITRARRRLILVTTLDTADGLLGDYLTYADPPAAADSRTPADPPAPVDPPPAAADLPPAPDSPALTAPLAFPSPDKYEMSAFAWADQLATELRRLEVVVRPGYRVGSWTVDLCVGSGDEPVGVVCGPHPDGPDAHVERQRALHRAGWRLLDAFESHWAGDPRRAALETAALLSASR
jgi:hypothetical protein